MLGIFVYPLCLSRLSLPDCVGDDPIRAYLKSQQLQLTMNEKKREARIQGLISLLRIERDHSKISDKHPLPKSATDSFNDARKALKKLRVSPEEIESRIVNYTHEAQFGALNAAYGTLTPSPESIGYKEGSGLLSQVYVLECSHQIRSSEKVGIISKGLLGKMVLCETCGANRKVTSAPSWVR